jgi:hypothetical protein
VDGYAHMLSLTIWSVGILLEALILIRSFHAGLFVRYPNFYLYVLSLFLSDTVMYAVYRMGPASYLKWTWYAGFVVLFLGCGILLEVFRHVLSSYPGAQKIAKAAGFVVVGAVVCFAVVYPFFAPADSVAQALYLRLQRDFVMVQAILLAGLLRVISYFRIPMGKNLRGMILGYGQCIGVTLIGLALRSYIGPRIQTAWSLSQQLSYVASLAIWAVALWSYRPSPKIESNIGSGGNYEALAARTKDMVGAAGAHLIKAERL